MNKTIDRLCCFLGIHQWNWGEIQNEPWVRYNDWGSTSYERDYIVGECQRCQIKTKKYLN